MVEQASRTLVEIGQKSDPGRDPDKQVNEDAFLHVETPLGLLAVVCDGMGGHAGGKEASELAVATIAEVIGEATTRTPRQEALRVALEEANRRVYAMPTAEAGHRPGSTVVAALVHESGVDIAHVGDSRVYLVHAGAIAQVTRDHSMVQELVDRKIIKPEDAATHPEANKILRALGIAKETQVEVRGEPLRYVAGDVLVLCTDGLSDLVTPPEILELAASAPPAQAAGRLVDLANARGGHDNITALVLRFDTSADARDAATIVQTLQLTAHDPPEAQRHGHATILSAPLPAPAPHAPQTAFVPPVAGQPHAHHAPHAHQAHQAHQAPHIPRAPESGARPSPRGGRGVLAIGIGLAVLGIAALAAGLFLNDRPKHHPVRVIDDVRDAAPPEPAAPLETPDQAPEPAPTLPPVEAPVPSHRGHAPPAPTPTPTPMPAPTPPPSFGGTNTR